MSKRRFKKGQQKKKSPTVLSRRGKAKAPKVPKAKAPKVPTKLKRVPGEERQAREIQARTTPPRRKLTSEELSSRNPSYSTAYYQELDKRGVGAWTAETARQAQEAGLRSNLGTAAAPTGTSSIWFNRLTPQSQKAVRRTPIYGGGGETPWYTATPAALSNIAGYGGMRMPAPGTPGGQVYINPEYAGDEGLLQHELTHILKNPYPWEGRELLNAMTPEQRAEAKDWYFRGEKPGIRGSKYSLQESSEIIPTLLEMADWNPANLPENLKPFFMQMGIFNPSAFQLAEPAYGRTETGAVALPPRID